MQISYNWLSQYIHLPESPKETVDMLTSLGLEVEHVKLFETVKGSLQGLVIGETLTCVKHPEADRLSLTTVDSGDDKPHQIVCGAPNIAAGQKVVVAKPGTTLYPWQGNPFSIKKTKIRGESSEGMICSEAEIGISATQDKTIVLDNCTLANGTPASSFYPIETDHIFEIGLTPNRGDATSHMGVARDISALTGRPLQWPSVDDIAIGKLKHTVEVTVEDETACPRYSAITLSGVTVKTSPTWLQNRLRSIGVTPVNNIVDVTNYICHAVGQPLHALDAHQIVGNKVLVKTVPSGSTYKTLDNKVRTLTGTELMICNTQEGMCMAGIMGGPKHGITHQTQCVFLESAYFSPEHIRKAGVHHHINTDSSFRFERGVNPELTVYALKKAALLIKEIAGGAVSSKIIDLYPHKINNKSITVKDKNVDRLIGIAIARKKIFDTLHALDIQVMDKNDTGYTVSVPPYRVGIEREADIIEEILRIYGLDHIPLKKHASANYLAPFSGKATNRYKKVLGEMLVANGFYEIITNSIIGNQYGQRYTPLLAEKTIDIVNASNPEQNTLRQTLLFSGLEVCAHNVNRKQKNLKLFEWGKTYSKSEDNYSEQECLALYMSGHAEAENWQQKPRQVTYFDLTKQIVALLEKCSLYNNTLQQTNREDDPLLEYSVEWHKENTLLVKAGPVKPQIAHDFGLDQEVFFANFNQDVLFGEIGKPPVITEIPKYPEVRRDLSLLLDNTITFNKVRDLALHTAQKYLKDIIVFDVYEGKNIPDNKKAYGIGFILLDESKTLREQTINKIMNKLIQAFEKKMGAIIRKS